MTADRSGADEGGRNRGAWMGDRKDWKVEAGVVTGLLLLTLALRLSILPDRWINPDEGAHLMDALLVLMGYVPAVDFGARQPLYVYTMAGMFQLTGVSLEAGRLFPLLCSLLVGVPLYLLVRELFGRSSALLALALWWMLPFEIRASSVVKTEPFAMLLAVSSVWAAVRGVRGPAGWMLAAGALAAAGFYVRESAIVLPLVILVFLAVHHGRRVRPAIGGFAMFLGGYAAVCLVASLFYLRWMGASAFVDFTPVRFVASALQEAVPIFPAAPVEEAAAMRLQYGEDPAAYTESLRQGVFLYLFLIVGAGFAGLRWLWSLRHGGGEHRAAFALALSWTVLLGLAYAWHFTQRGFWVDYSREFAPPLILAFVGWIPIAAPELRKRRAAIKLIVGTVVLGGAWIIFQRQFHGFYGLGHHVSLGVVLFLLFYHVRSLPVERRGTYAAGMVAVTGLIVGGRFTPFGAIFTGPVGALVTLTLAAGFAGWVLVRSGRNAVGTLSRSLPLGLVVGALVVTLSHGARNFNIKFQGVWSPEALAEVADYIRETTHPDDRVMSGGVVWELEAHRLPWGLYSHPMSIQRILPPDESAALTAAFKAAPPEVIVMDGITERTFGPNIVALEETLASEYRLIMEPIPVTFPVRVYRRMSPPPLP